VSHPLPIVETVDRDPLLEGLNDAQQAAVTTAGAPLCIVAGAGSGKTRVLTRRIAHRVLLGSADAAHVLAVTFTRKAAGELRSRLQALGVREQVVAGTFHAVAYAQLRRRWADRGERAPALLDRKVRLVAPLLPRVTGSRPALQPADVAAEIEWAKARLVDPSAYEAEAEAAGRTPPLAPAAMAALYQRYEAEKRRRGVVDFDDLLVLCARALDDPEFAAAQRWRFRHLFVDEFQDVNPAQARLLEGWLGDRDDLCVVGDPNQAIYSWNGADPGLLAGFHRRFPVAEVIRLDDNYRSSPQVVAVANAVLEAPRLRAHQPDGPVPTIRCYDSEVAEARGVAARLRRAHRPGVPWSDLAVLMRTNAQGVLFEEALRAAAVPYRVRGEGAFLQRPEVRGALGELARSPSRAPFVAHLRDLEAMVAEAAGSDDRRLSLEGLLRLAHQYVALDPEGSVGGFCAWLAITVQADDDGGGDAVELATFHRAKGLEWPVVFVTGLERGLVPIARAETPEAEAEERRLLYVAVTRARSELHCSWAKRRAFGGRTLSRAPSPYLARLEAACEALHRGGPDVDWRPRLERERRRLRQGANADPDVLTALKAWRSAAAKAASVPAYVIFHDTTLAAVAEAKPADRAALLAIPGLGPVKAERYGDALLAVVAEHGRSA
jgi:DNA helicase-2/ATP-dependent DNA helicase PcrA